MTYTFTGDEIATILHGLRMIQETANGEMCCRAADCDHFESWTELTDPEIDALCERLNPLDAEKPPATPKATSPEFAAQLAATPTAPIGEQASAQDAAYIAAAREQWANDELEIDEDAKVSAGGDPGAWVSAWVWVTDIDAGICSSCGDVNANNGEGWDGLCGNCADKEEASK